MPLALGELFEPGGNELKPTAKARSLVGKRVRLVGFMAEMEIPAHGGFFLTRHPVHLDEAGAGTADMPLDAVRVIAPSMAGKVIPWMKGALEMTGIFELGNSADEDGRVSAFRLRLDGPLESQVAMTHSSPGGPPSPVARKTDAP